MNKKTKTRPKKLNDEQKLVLRYEIEMYRLKLENAVEQVEDLASKLLDYSDFINDYAASISDSLEKIKNG
jgi:hypothetical protein